MASNTEEKPFSLDKPFYKSKTVIGAVAVLVSLILRSAGVDVPQVEIEEALYNLGTFVGTIVTIYGRYVADKKISLT